MGKGVRFFIFSIIGSFLFYPVISLFNLETRIVDLFKQLWLITCLYWNTYYHLNWIKGLVEKK
jgi:hypothetical protein